MFRPIVVAKKNKIMEKKIKVNCGGAENLTRVSVF